ncbi:hypothetical protein SAMN02745248_02427 [Hathewaya proteolytica DSM 3090]|uniref:Uncharacterized protein n=1 Tax=Hathewaya proteolytica DSM 3090 TaxID=1121331 RepID=A0A1M6S1Y4_9CLOT|nr:hypothetical protein [Hathewaya proteolytica]SHK38713.1 hypothetical protein SAMN02745248_02427 [Hathewaya proteolytica DSM 3090]
MINIIYKVGDKIKVLSGCSVQVKQGNAKRDQKKVKGMNGRIIEDYEHFYLVQHKNFKECYSKASLLCKDTIFKIM